MQLLRTSPHICTDQTQLTKICISGILSVYMLQSQFHQLNLPLLKSLHRNPYIRYTCSTTHWTSGPTNRTIHSNTPIFFFVFFFSRYIIFIHNLSGCETFKNWNLNKYLKCDKGAVIYYQSLGGGSQ